MRLLIADKLPDSAVQRFEGAGFEVDFSPELKDQSLRDRLFEGQAEVLVVRSTQVTGDMLRASRLGLVVRAGAGVNTIDVDAASACGIYVANCPGKNNLAVAELCIGLLLSLDRRIPDAAAELRAGRWNKAEFSKANGLAGRTLGVLGCGRIGLAVAERALALGMRVLGWDISPQARKLLRELGCEYEPQLEALLPQCDAVSLHLPSTPGTRHLADRRFFESLKNGAYLINTSRADVVDESALLWALDAKDLRAGLDVFDGEVIGGTGEVSSALLQHPRVWATPHIGASTRQAQEAVADLAIDIIGNYRNGGAVPSVNVNKKSPASHLLVLRHRNRVGVLSQVFSTLKDYNINAEETENIVFSGASACIARIAIDSAPPEEALSALRGSSEDILDLKLVELGAAS